MDESRCRVLTVDVVVIGAGAAGLLAAGMAAAAGARVLLLEKMPKPGSKLAITGKGRCNLTNIEPRGAFESHFGPTAGTWLRPAFDMFFSDALMTFMVAQGMALTTERGGRVFPAGGRAPDVVNALVAWARCQGVETRLRCEVRRIRTADGRVSGVETSLGLFGCKAVVLAAGGASYPATGSAGDGFRLAAMAGLDVVPPQPALVPLETSPRPGTGIDGLGLRNVRVALLVDGMESACGFGEMSFTAHGVSGPLVLTLSGKAVAALDAHREVRLRVDLKPALSEEKLYARLDRDLAARASEPMRSLLRGLLPKPLVAPCLTETDIRGMMTGGHLPPDQRWRLVRWMKGMVLTVSGHRGMSEAIVTAGGVALDAVCPETMAARSLAGLFLAGEVLDVAGDTGGYNLQAAFSTGVLAGRSAAGFSRAGSGSPRNGRSGCVRRSRPVATPRWTGGGPR